MRDFKGMKRQRGRNRKPGGGQGGGHGNNPNRAFDSTGPEGVKVRGNAQTVYERYQQLARDAASSGDRVLAENCLQHAEHYFRILRSIQPQRSVSEIAARDAFAQGFDIDYEEEAGQREEAGVAEGQGDQPQPQGQSDDRGERGDRGDRERDRGERGDRDQREFRGERDRDRDREPREDRQRGEGEQREGREGREGRGRRDRYERRDRRPRDDHGGDQSQTQPQAAPAAAEPSQDAGVSQLPGFLHRPTPQPAPASPAAEAGEEAPPKRTRAPRRKPEPAPAED